MPRGKATASSAPFTEIDSLFQSELRLICICANSMPSFVTCSSTRWAHLAGC